MGRRSKLTVEITEQICNEIKRGMPLSKAPLIAGITVQTFYKWYNKGEKARSGKFKQFYDKVEEAKAYAIALRVENIRKAGQDGTWQADAWWLERIDPKNFGLRKDISLKGDLKHEHNITNLFDEELIDTILNEYHED
ncbi:hypothetical protein [uncultured Methanobrevibacter sp.]|uniref:hypothetical protein n=1 Tax=uncultured Methanobrevibacter sp. TaxID=253161 RepID=UPI00260EF517|nr:hypothetical protein [uncultured Methanobrevibacter sp.]